MKEIGEAQFKKDAEEAMEILRSPEWLQYTKFLATRKVRFQTKVNDAVKKGFLLEARVNLALLEDSDDLVGSFKKQVLENKNKLSKEKP